MLHTTLRKRLRAVVLPRESHSPCSTSRSMIGVPDHSRPAGTRAGTPTALAILAGTLATLLAGCDLAQVVDPPVAACPADVAQRAETTVLTVPATSAEPLPALSPAVVDELERAGRTDIGCLLLVRPDAEPEALSLTPRRGGQVDVGSRREALRQNTLAAIREHITDLTATEDGLDTLAAIRRATSAHPEPGRLVVLSSGVSTVDPVDLRQLGWDVHGPTLGRFLHREGYLDLTGWEVSFVGLGEVAGNQPPLPAPVRQQLSRTWLGICESAGARRCIDAGAAVEPKPPRSTNAVPPVPLPTTETFVDSMLLSAATSFRFDSDVLSPGADLALGLVVGRVTKNDLILTITGHADASTGDKAYNRDLSRRRAEAVRTRLIQLGLPGDRVVAIDGLGSAGFSAEEEARNPSLRDQHRKVEIHFSRRPSTD